MKAVNARSSPLTITTLELASGGITIPHLSVCWSWSQTVIVNLTISCLSIRPAFGHQHQLEQSEYSPKIRTSISTRTTKFGLQQQLEQHYITVRIRTSTSTTQKPKIGLRHQRTPLVRIFALHSDFKNNNNYNISPNLRQNSDTKHNETKPNIRIYSKSEYSAKHL